MGSGTERVAAPLVSKAAKRSTRAGVTSTWNAGQPISFRPSHRTTPIEKKVLIRDRTNTHAGARTVRLTSRMLAAL